MAPRTCTASTATRRRPHCWSSSRWRSSTCLLRTRGRCLERACTHASRTCTRRSWRRFCRKPARRSGPSACGTSAMAYTTRAAWASCAGFCSACSRLWAWVRALSGSVMRRRWQSSRRSGIRTSLCASSSMARRCWCGCSASSSAWYSATAWCCGLAAACLVSSTRSSSRTASRLSSTSRARWTALRSTRHCATRTTSTTTA
mmetsp:Transcript_12118/g.35662  ORF Transcript_12118/g.35662 Transcript_12118/m.35662 type:complete len:202 (-) Transcript_12118:431-1036(-)